MNTRPAPRPVIAGALLVLLGLLGTWRLWDWEAEREHLGVLDLPVQHAMSRDQRGLLDGLATMVSAVATPEIVPVVVVLAALGWALATRGKRPQWWLSPALLATSVVLASLAVTGLKNLIGRSRPPLADMVDGVDHSYSFPSGHTCLFATTALVLVWLLTRESAPWRRTAWFLAAALASGLVALSRLYLGYHWLTDVCASASISLGILGAVMVADGVLRRPEAAGRP